MIDKYKSVSKERSISEETVSEKCKQYLFTLHPSSMLLVDDERGLVSRSRFIEDILKKALLNNKKTTGTPVNHNNSFLKKNRISELKTSFRICWYIGPTGEIEGKRILHSLVKETLMIDDSTNVDEILNKFVRENSDLNGISVYKLKECLGEDYSNLKEIEQKIKNGGLI